jgi:hypothetical protein
VFSTGPQWSRELEEDLFFMKTDKKVEERAIHSEHGWTKNEPAEKRDVPLTKMSPAMP